MHTVCVGTLSTGFRYIIKSIIFFQSYFTKIRLKKRLYILIMLV
jgi:hypothetical protein